MAVTTVLVVEDASAIADLMAELLTEHGCATTVCEDPATALVFATDLNPDIVVFDFRMPGMDGREFYTALRGLGIECPAVLCSAWKEAGIVANELGIPFVHKPFDIDDFVATVTTAIAS